jgi:hypothetical protein
MKIKPHFSPLHLIVFFYALCLAACSGSETELVIDESVLSAYQALANPKPAENPIEDIDCYLDYSYGMGEGMKATESLNSRLRNFLIGKKVSYYMVGASDVPPAIDINSKEANFLEMNNFTEPGSKLKAAIDKIILNVNKSSVFITDFERVDDVNLKQHLNNAPKPHPIDASAWALNDFKDWLMAGNQIDIFTKQFRKPDFWFGKKNKKDLSDNWIYTIVFTPDYIIRDETLYKQSVLKFLDDEYVNLNGSDTRHFTYTCNHFKIEQDKKDDAIGDANDNIVVQENMTNTKEKGFEYYNFLSSDLLNFNLDETQKDKRIINKVMITSHNTCFSAIEYGLKAYDITASLTDFFTSRTQEAPEVNSDEETGKKDTIANKPVNYTYKQGTPVNDIFDFVYNPDKHAIGIKLKPDFTGVEQNTVYQVDIVVKSGTLKNFSDEDNVLALNYSNGYKITSLGASLKLAMTEVATRMENKVLYTIYIKIDK